MYGFATQLMIARVEKLGKFKEFAELNGNRTRDLAACGIVPKNEEGILRVCCRCIINRSGESEKK
jgi:hypothetical protein